MDLKVACIQMNSGADMPENIASLTKLVGEAAARGAKFICTPENIFLMEEAGERVFYTQENHPGVIAAAALAKKHGVWLLVGSVAVLPSLRAQRSNPEDEASWIAASPTAPRNDKTYNRSLLFHPEGHIAAAYDKIHLFDVDIPGDRSYRESDKMLGGGKLVLASLDDRRQMTDGKEKNLSSVIRHPSSITIGLTICYDLRFPHLYRALAKAGAQVLCVPAAFTKITGIAHWHTLLRARAIENSCFVIAPAQTGTHPAGRETFGHSLIIDPWGRVLADGGEGVGVVTADIDLDEVAKTRAQLPCLEHDRAFD